MTDHEQVIVRMPAELHQAIKAMAAKNERSMAAEIRVAIRKHLQHAYIEFGGGKDYADG